MKKKRQGGMLADPNSVVRESESYPLLSQQGQAKEQAFKQGIQATDWYKEFEQQYGEPPDLRPMSDDPKLGPNYDYLKAWESGMRPVRDPYDNNRYHWGSALPGGEMLKSENHPTAWKEHFMRQYGVNPDALPADMTNWPVLQATPDERQSVEDEEHRFYAEHPQSTLELSPTDWVSPFGMPVLQDQHGKHHSESSATGRIPFGLGIPLDASGKYMTHGMIWPDRESGKSRYFTGDESMDLIIKNNFVNPVSQEQIPLFETEDEAVQYAIDRDLILRDRKYPWNQ